MPYNKRPRRRQAKRSAPRRARKAKPSKSLTRAVKQIVKTNVETKTINVPSAVTPTTNNANVPYGALSGLQYLVQDVFKVSQGVTDSTAITASNRLGDKIRAVGFLMDYYIHLPSFYTLERKHQE